MTLYHCGYLSTSIMISQRTLAGAEIIDFVSTRTTQIFEYPAIDAARIPAISIILVKIRFFTLAPGGKALPNDISVEADTSLHLCDLRIY